MFIWSVGYYFGMGNQLGISKKYLKFFVENNESRWVLIQGGRRSGKSFSVIKWLWFLASATPNSTVLFVAASFPALQFLMNDFQRATPLKIEGSTVYGYNCTLSNGSRFLFKSFDDFTKTQGSTADFLYLEEALNIPVDIVTTLSMSVTRQIFACYNPTKKSDLDRYISKDGSNHIVTTWKDNDFLTVEQRNEFESIKTRAMKPTATTMDIYAYKVYYLGEYGEMSGKVFNLIYNCSDDEFDRVPVKPLYGLDFGFVQSKDQTAFVAVKIWNNEIYCKELIFDNGSLYNDKKLAFALSDIGINEYENIVADWGGLGKTRIKNLVTAGNGDWVEDGINHGFSVMNAKKGKIIDGIQKMLNYEKIYVTSTSENLRREFDRYELNPSGAAKGEDHLIDAVRYAVNSWDIVNY